MVQFFIKGLYKTYVLDLALESTIQDLKQDIYQREGIPVQLQRISRQHQHLDQEQWTLQQCGIYERDEIQVHLGLFGGLFGMANVGPTATTNPVSTTSAGAGASANTTSSPTTVATTTTPAAYVPPNLLPSQMQLNTTLACVDLTKYANYRMDSNYAAANAVISQIFAMGITNIEPFRLVTLTTLLTANPPLAYQGQNLIGRDLNNNQNGNFIMYGMFFPATSPYLPVGDLCIPLNVTNSNYASSSSNVNTDNVLVLLVRNDPTNLGISIAVPDTAWSQEIGRNRNCNNPAPSWHIQGVGGLPQSMKYQTNYYIMSEIYVPGDWFSSPDEWGGIGKYLTGTSYPQAPGPRNYAAVHQNFLQVSYPAIAPGPLPLKAAYPQYYLTNPDFPCSYWVEFWLTSPFGSFVVFGNEDTSGYPYAAFQQPYAFYDILPYTLQAMCCGNAGAVGGLNCGTFNGGNNMSNCGQAVLLLGSSALATPSWQSYVRSQPGQFDGIYGTFCADPNNAQSNFCSCTPGNMTGIDPTLSLAQQQLIATNPPCFKPACLIQGYKDTNQLSQTCSFALQSCLQNQGIQNAGQITGTPQLSSVINCVLNQTTVTNPGVVTPTPTTSGTASTPSTTGTTGSGTGTVTSGTSPVSTTSTSGTPIPLTPTPSTTATTTPAATTTTSNSFFSSSTFFYLVIGFLGLVFLGIVIAAIKSKGKNNNTAALTPATQPIVVLQKPT